MGVMFNRFFLSLAICLPFPALADARMSNVSCDDSTRMTQKLTEVLGVQRKGMGLRDPDTTLEIWVTHKSGEWVIVQSYANGTSCIVAMGEHWQDSITGPA